MTHSTNHQLEKYHFVITVLLGVSGLLLVALFVLLQTRAGESTPDSSVTVSNSAPTITSMTVTAITSTGQTYSTIDADNPLTIAEDTTGRGANSLGGAGTSTLKFAISFTDTNGCQEVTEGANRTALYAFINDEATSTCYTTGSHEDPADCYIVFASTTFNSGGGNGSSHDFGQSTSNYRCDYSDCSGDDSTGVATCYMDIYDFADQSNSGASAGYKWSLSAVVNDGTVTSATSTVHSEFNEFTAFVASSTMSFGSGVAVAYGSTSTKQIGVDNVSNDKTFKLTWSVSSVGGSDAQDFSCTRGAISTSSLHMASSAAYAAGDNFTAGNHPYGLNLAARAAASEANFVAAAGNDFSNEKQTATGTEKNKVFYWGIFVTAKSAAAGGTCSATLSVSAS